MANGLKDLMKRSADNLIRLCGQQVSITFGKDDKKYFCLCLGVSNGKFFLTQMPVDPDIDKKLTPGNKAIIRFVESGKVCGFKTSICQAFTKPFRLIFFDFPEYLEMINLRTSKRVTVSLEAVIKMGDDIYDGLIKDLSNGGCLFVMKYSEIIRLDDLGKNSKLSIKFTLMYDDSPVQLQCTPVRLGKDKEEISMGLSFDEDQQESLDKVNNFIHFINQLFNNGTPEQ